MTKVEAAALVTMLVAAFPGARFGPENAAAYEAGLLDLAPAEGQAAVGELINSALFLPSIAAIRNEAFRQRKLAADRSRVTALQLPEASGPPPHEWAKVLADLLESSERHRRMSEAWYRARGKKAPPDPAQAFIDLAQRGARGEDVRARFRHTVLGDQDEQERRYP